MDRSAVREAAMQNGDPRPFLRMRDCRERCGKRPCNRRAAGKSNELPPDHSVTSSASDGGPADHGISSSHTLTGSWPADTTFQLGAMSGVGNAVGSDDEFDLAHIGRETDTATHVLT